MSSAFHVVEHTVPCQHIREYPQATSGEQEDVLHLAVKQYIPKYNPDPQPGDITVIAGHANGFPKELYEPLWEDLIERSRSAKFRIRGIWIADVAWQGHSGVLNEQLLGNDPGWNDHARDLLHMINLKRDQMPRPIVGIGHSMGGNNLVLLSLMHPRLFTTLILIDPVILQFSSTPPGSGPYPVQLSTYRRDVWPSRQEAAEAFKKSKFYQQWDPRVLQRWIEHGLRDLPTAKYPHTQGVTLTTTKDQEVFTFARPNFQRYGLDGRPVNRDTHADLDPENPTIYPFYRAEGPNALRHLPELRPSVLYVFGETSSLSTPELQEARLKVTGVGIGGSGGRALGRVKATTVPKVGHLVAMEDVGKTADGVSSWLELEMERWRKDEAASRETWSKEPLVEKQAIDEKWKEMVGEPPGKTSQPSKL